MKPEISDEEEAHLKTAFLLWIEIRGAETGQWFPAGIGLGSIHKMAIDMEKSCLLRRLADGKKPFKEPPPTRYSAPWYALLEAGSARVNDVYLDPEGTRWWGDPVIVIGHCVWLIEKEESKQDFVCRYSIRSRLDETDRRSSTTWRISSDGDDGRNLGLLSQWWKIVLLTDPEGVCESGRDASIEGS